MTKPPDSKQAIQLLMVKTRIEAGGFRHQIGSARFSFKLRKQPPN
ncbi:hypothetical protein HSB1_47750 [Halogranum salarium B-1]|uniref:Uncharacterized protein n=1 Tax=Halogranum salarium B-1 TaxID=1210908 RepID=J2ZV94_9EURY|nr:hypothetical protein HSB1_47750 [Halogranum salarium B-1]